MKVHINQIPAEGRHYEGEEPVSILELKEPLFRSSTPIQYSLDVGVSGSGLFATGSLAMDAEFHCVTCLEAFSFPLRVDDFATQIELTTSETVDLTDPIREDILLALPAHPHCDWNGERECKGPFYPANTENAGELSERPEVWGALDQLKLKKNT